MDLWELFDHSVEDLHLKVPCFGTSLNCLLDGVWCKLDLRGIHWRNISFFRSFECSVIFGFFQSTSVEIFHLLDEVLVESFEWCFIWCSVCQFHIGSLFHGPRDMTSHFWKLTLALLEIDSSFKIFLDFSSWHSVEEFHISKELFFFKFGGTTLSFSPSSFHIVVCIKTLFTNFDSLLAHFNGFTNVKSLSFNWFPHVTSSSFLFFLYLCDKDIAHCTHHVTKLAHFSID